MQVNCSHCGRPNEAPDPPPGSAGQVVCASCGRPFEVSGGGSPALGRVNLRKVAAPRSEFEALGSTGLGGLDEGEPDAFDLSAILDPVPGGAPGPTTVEPATASEFTFGSPGDLFGGSGPTSGESTRVVDLDPAAALREVDEAATPSPQASGWRVRSERGLVYELMTVDAVVAWLEGKSDVSGVRIARGDGAFQEVTAFPEVASRLGIRPGAEVAPPTLSGGAAGGGGGELSLAMERAPSPQKRAAAAQAASKAAASSGPRPERAERPQTQVKEARRIENPVGMGSLLAALVGVLVVAAAGVFVGVKSGAMPLPPPLEETAEAAEPPPVAELAEAIAAYEAGNYTSATRRLKTLAKSGDDPRAWRHLALSLHKSNRDAEAREALAEYRRRMQQAGGDGRQVREVQH